MDTEHVLKKPLPVGNQQMEVLERSSENNTSGSAVDNREKQGCKPDVLSLGAVVGQKYAHSAPGPKNIQSRKIEPKEIYLNIIHFLASHQFSQEEASRIDEFSMKSMALALEFTGIDSIEKACRLNLKIIPPGSVFYTWTAIHNTTIFDGKNNPEKHKGLDYVKKIKEESGRLEKQGIPVLVVYSEHKMTVAQVSTMRGLFSNNKNIVTLSYEKDLNFSFKESLLDGIRVDVINNYPKVLKIALTKAVEQKKEKAMTGLKAKTNSICYSDIDNTWLKPIPYMISFCGLYSFPSFYYSFTLLYLREEQYQSLEEMKQLPKSIRDRINNHQLYFIGHPYLKDEHTGNQKQFQWTSKEADRSFNYIISGEADREYKAISNILYDNKVDTVIFEHDSLWSGDNSLISVNRDSILLFREKTDRTLSYINCFKNEDWSKNTDHIKAHSLTGIQLWRCFAGGRDYTWT